MRDPLMLDALAEVLADIVSRHAFVRDDGGTWLRADEAVQDGQGSSLTVAAGLHPAVQHDAARDALDRLALQGFGIRRAPPKAGNTLAARLARLSADLAGCNGQPRRIQAIAVQMAALAEEAAERDAAVIPAHLRLTGSTLPNGVTRLCDRRRA